MSQLRKRERGNNNEEGGKYRLWEIQRKKDSVQRLWNISSVPTEIRSGIRLHVTTHTEFFFQTSC